MATNFKACSVDGCNGNAHHSVNGVARGYCKAHYSRFLRHGDPLGGSTSTGDRLRFLNDVAVHHKGDDCLDWPFPKSNKGYSQVLIGERQIVTHRYICMIAHGLPPTPLHEAAHSCGNTSCVNPSHLSWKTPVQNAADKLAHGTHICGEGHYAAKLTEEDVRFVRSSPATATALADMLGVSRSAVSDARRRKTWICVD